MLEVGGLHALSVCNSEDHDWSHETRGPACAMLGKVGLRGRDRGEHGGVCGRTVVSQGKEVSWTVRQACTVVRSSAALMAASG